MATATASKKRKKQTSSTASTNGKPASKKKEAKKDLSETYNEFKDFEGTQYTGMSATEMINHVINKIQQFIYQHPGIHFFFFSEINQPAINSISTSSPLVLIDQRSGIHGAKRCQSF